MQPYTPRPATAALDNLVMRVYPAEGDCDNTYTLYEDDGVTLDYQKGACATTALNYKQVGGKATVTVNPAEGSYEGQVQKRAYTLQLPAANADTKVKVNGKKAKVRYDEGVKAHVVDVKATAVNRPVVIEYNI